MFRKLFSSNQQAIVGLDLGSSSIKVAQVVKSPEGFKVLKLRARPTPTAGVKDDGRIIDPALLGKEVKMLFEDAGITAKQIVSTVSGSHVIVRTVTMPVMTEKELQHSIRYEAERYIPYSVAEAQVAGSVLRNPIPGDEKNMEVLLLASPKEIVQGVESTIAAAGLDAAAIELESLALLRIAKFVLLPEVLKQTIALINIGASSTSISIFKDESLRNSRTISLAGNSFTRAISQAMNTNFEEAEKLKREKAVVRIEMDTTPIPPASVRIFNVILPVLSELTTEIQRSFDFYRSRYRGESVDAIYLSGGTSLLKNLDQYLAGELGVHVEMMNPIPGKTKEGIPGASPEEAVQLPQISVVALGLATRQII